MTTTRANDVAEVLWELKRAEKIATYSAIAERAGFSAGTNGRTMLTCMKAIRRDWPHLQWWRAVKDGGQIEKNGEQANCLIEGGYELIDAEKDDESSVIMDFEEHLMVWDAEAAESK